MRRGAGRGLRALLVAVAALLPAAACAFGFDDVDRRAAALAAKPYEPPKADLPEALGKLDYDQYRDIRFRNDRALWRAQGLPFEVALFHRGGFFVPRVRIHEVAEGEPRELGFDARAFDYGRNALDPGAWGDIGFAGLRVHFPVNSPAYKDEVLVFLGASYFRALGQGQRYGLSARGLAIDTALASGEEFPRFTEFWLERPTADSTHLVIHALLDSPSVAGAYRFVLRPGTETALEVRARIHARRDVAKLGIAPLTSMYLFGENQHAAVEDYRPEVHDSDGLAVHAGNGEWIWRPLVNPRRLLVTSFATDAPQGFGLQQRDRAFSSYEDLEARYELRPSAWVKPLKPFGAGRVELVQIPTDAEHHDNIVASWTPEAPLRAGGVVEAEYAVLWQKDALALPASSHVAQTRRGAGWVRRTDTVDLHVDFTGQALTAIAAGNVPQAVFQADGNGEIVEQVVQRHPVHGGARVSLRIRRIDPAKPVELRGYLRHEAATVSETWAYVLPPD